MARVADPIRRVRVAVRGAVQGVGFRPFVYRLAAGLGLAGWVNNSPAGVQIEVEGSAERVDRFLARLEAEAPPRAAIRGVETRRLAPAGYASFEIRESEAAGGRTTLVLPDLATCDDCLREMWDRADRRHRYPFTNCTNCGPRFTIVEALPYDRPNTTMRGFAMCGRCRAEYENPLDRRFHAQPVACPDCGPHLDLWAPDGRALAARDEALRAAADAVRAGAIVAVKGLGGFHLLADARAEEAVRALRARKHREEKPLALMFPSLDAVRRSCEVSDLEARLLRSPEAPIVLLPRADSSEVAPSVAPHNPRLGAMLPYTPLHHLLLAELGFPVVATSGNLSDEPICTDEREALRRLGGIADLFLVHDRPIARHVDDSVVRVVLGRDQILRRARGYAPLPIPLGAPPAPVLAVGAHLKNAIALTAGDGAFVSQHVGDLDSAQAFEAFERVVRDFRRLYEVEPVAVACDAHPAYLSTAFAERQGLPVERVQHHHAHVAACLAEHGIEGPALGVSWDGTGYGPDGTVWGGEFLRVEGGEYARVAHLRTFRLPGGERAVREPRRAALGVLHELFGAAAFAMDGLPPVAAFGPEERRVLATMLRRRVNSPLTSSAGRLFDAAAALAGLRQVSTFEGQAAMEFEHALASTETGGAYPAEVRPGEDGGGTLVVDWGPLVRALLRDLRDGVPAGAISARFHDALAAAIVEVARRAGLERVALTGGCFQNAYLTVRTVRALRRAGFRPCWHRLVPPNDGGIALGQVAVALARREAAPARGMMAPAGRRV